MKLRGHVGCVVDPRTNKERNVRYRSTSHAVLDPEVEESRVEPISLCERSLFDRPSKAEGQPDGHLAPKAHSRHAAEKKNVLDTMNQVLS